MIGVQVHRGPSETMWKSEALFAKFRKRSIYIAMRRYVPVIRRQRRQRLGRF